MQKTHYNIYKNLKSVYEYFNSQNDLTVEYIDEIDKYEIYDFSPVSWHMFLLKLPLHILPSKKSIRNSTKTFYNQIYTNWDKNFNWDKTYEKYLINYFSYQFGSLYPDKYHFIDNDEIREMLKNFISRNSIKSDEDFYINLALQNLVLVLAENEIETNKNFNHTYLKNYLEVFNNLLKNPSLISDGDKNYLFNIFISKNISNEILKFISKKVISLMLNTPEYQNEIKKFEEDPEKNWNYIFFSQLIDKCINDYIFKDFTKRINLFKSRYKKFINENNEIESEEKKHIQISNMKYFLRIAKREIRQVIKNHCNVYFYFANFSEIDKTSPIGLKIFDIHPITYLFKTNSKIFIIEGADKLGKTSFIEDIQNLLTKKDIKHTYTHFPSADIYEKFSKLTTDSTSARQTAFSYDTLLEFKENLLPDILNNPDKYHIIDRAFLSCLVYSTLDFKNETDKHEYKTCLKYLYDKYFPDFKNYFIYLLNINQIILYLENDSDFNIINMKFDKDDVIEKHFDKEKYLKINDLYRDKKFTQKQFDEDLFKHFKNYHIAFDIDTTKSIDKKRVERLYLFDNIDNTLNRK